MSNAGPRAHALDISSLHHRSGPQTIVMRKASRQDVGDDFHVAMSMGSEAGPRRYPVVVDNPQRTKARLLRIVVVTEGKRVAAIEPIKASCAALAAVSN